MPARRPSAEILVAVRDHFGHRHGGEEPPYGDARRNLDYLRRHPELYQELLHLSRSEQAARVEAKDRGIVAPFEQRALGRALAEARQEERPRTISPLERALGGALLSL